MRSRPLEVVARGTALDAAAALLLACLAVNATMDPPGPAFAGPASVVWLAAAAVGLPVVLRRRWPVPVLGWTLAAASSATAFGVVGVGVIWVTWVPVALALYSVATSAGRAATALALVVGLLAPSAAIPWLYISAGITPSDAPRSEAPLWWEVELGMVIVALTVAWLVGWTVRWRRSVHADAARRLAKEAVSEERLRIARELHDIVGHSLSIIKVRAMVANQIGDSQPGAAQAALRDIEGASRSALVETRRLLDILRPDDASDDLTPSPSVGDLPRLAEETRSSGLRVDLTADETADLPPAVGLTVYRIVQEALTNVVKHANAAGCQVTVQTKESGVHIEVLDDGQRRRPPVRRRSGQGLIGMRERVGLYGGTLVAGPRRHGGFQVIATLPFGQAELDA